MASEQRLGVVTAVVADPVDEERRCSVDPAADSAEEVLPHSGGMRPASEPPKRNGLEVETESGGVFD